jgi:hypothetical protein
MLIPRSPFCRHPPILASQEQLALRGLIYECPAVGCFILIRAYFFIYNRIEVFEI